MKNDKRWVAYTNLWFLLVTLSTAIITTVFIKQHKMIREKPEEVIEVVEVDSEPLPPPPKDETQTPQTIVIEIERPYEKIVYLEPEDETVLDFSDIKLMAALICAEAGNQDFIGKRLVADVILNRYYDEDFPNTIEEVIYQSGQFNAIVYMDGYNEDDLEAVCLELNARLDKDILYFANNGFHEGHPKAYQHGDHYFSYK